MNRRVLVTGASGFVGAHVCRRIIAEGGEVVALMRRNRPGGPLAHLGVSEFVHKAVGDVCDANFVARLVNEYDVSHIVHLAGQAIPQVALEVPNKTFEANIASAWSVLDAARQHTALRAVIMLSTSKVYSVSQQPTEITKHREIDVRDMLETYGASKRCAEVLAESYRVSFGVPAVSLRLANTYGPADPHRARLVPMAIDRAISGKPLHVHGDGKQPLDLLYIDDAVDGIILALDNARKLGQPAYNIGSSQVVTVQQVVDAVRQVAPRNLQVSYGSGLPHPTAVLDITQFERVVGYCPRTSLESGIAKTLQTDVGIQSYQKEVG